MLLKKRRVTAPVGPAAPPAPQPVFLVEDDLEDEGPFSPFKFPVSGTPESGYLPPNLSYQSLVKTAFRGSLRDRDPPTPSTPSTVVESKKETAETPAEPEQTEPSTSARAKKSDEAGWNPRWKTFIWIESKKKVFGSANIGKRIRICHQRC